MYIEDAQNLKMFRIDVCKSFFFKKTMSMNLFK